MRTAKIPGSFHELACSCAAHAHPSAARGRRHGLPDVQGVQRVLLLSRVRPCFSCFSCICVITSSGEGISKLPILDAPPRSCKGCDGTGKMTCSKCRGYGYLKKGEGDTCAPPRPLSLPSGAAEASPCPARLGSPNFDPGGWHPLTGLSTPASPTDSPPAASRRSRRRASRMCRPSTSAPSARARRAPCRRVSLACPPLLHPQRRLSALQRAQTDNLRRPLRRARPTAWSAGARGSCGPGR